MESAPDVEPVYQRITAAPAPPRFEDHYQPMDYSETDRPVTAEEAQRLVNRYRALYFIPLRVARRRAVAHLAALLRLLELVAASQARHVADMLAAHLSAIAEWAERHDEAAGPPGDGDGIVVTLTAAPSAPPRLLAYISTLEASAA
jgi:class 3 adenylate cyclase